MLSKDSGTAIYFRLSLQSRNREPKKHRIWNGRFGIGGETMGEKIKIHLSDWQFNAGVVGLCNILDYAKDEVVIREQYIEIYPEVLEHFEEKYFNYFIEKYKETTPWYRIVSYKPIIENHKNNDFESFDKESLDYLNDYIRMVKDYLSRNNYKKVYPFIESDKNIASLDKRIKDH